GRSPRDKVTVVLVFSRSRSTVPSVPCCACCPGPLAFASSGRWRRRILLDLKTTYSS
ncbi:hypothetical protein ALC57_01931, partial [Trachymyrmex cornetzi]